MRGDHRPGEGLQSTVTVATNQRAKGKRIKVVHGGEANRKDQQTSRCEITSIDAFFQFSEVMNGSFRRAECSHSMK